MSLYREAGSRRGRAVAVLAAALVVGLLVGFAAGWALKPEPTLADRLDDLQAQVRDGLDALELVPVHYESTNPVTRRAAVEQLAAARDEVLGARSGLDALQPGAAERLERAFDRLERQLEQGANVDEVESAAAALERQVRQSARLD
jgi:hypothetical protein